MQTEKYIRNAIENLNTKVLRENRIRENDIEEFVKTIIINVQKHRYDFKCYETLKIKQDDKKREVKKYKDFSIEQILCQCIKQMLDNKLRIRYPNRNVIIHEFFDCLKSVKVMADFTVIKVDFKKYFDSISCKYVYEKYVKNKITDREERNLIEEYVSQVEYAYTGLATSNLLAEIIALDFDKNMQMELSDMGLVFYKRYIDDTVIILNRYIDENICNDILDKCLKRVFYDKEYSSYIQCRTTFNEDKKKIITKRLIGQGNSLDFLGYEIFFKCSGQGRVCLQYGITQKKMEKYSKRMNRLVEEYCNDNDMELLRQRILAFSSRVVYRRKRYNKDMWKVKGFINNYGELRYLLGSGMIHSDTEIFLKNMIIKSFEDKGILLPTFIKSTSEQKGYNLYYNLMKNKTILLVENIGYNKIGLERMCKKIGINIINKKYENLVKEYLIKMKVGY